MAGPSPGSPSINCVDITDYDLQLPAWSLENLKLAATQLKLGRPQSLAWAVLLNALPPPNTDIVKSIKGHRNYYNDLRSRLSRDPRNVIGDDPLSQNDESAWKQHFCDNELKALILQDVVRTFPDELYFRDKEVQDMMVRVLFCWSREHASVGYRQGMHEILAPILYELYLDRRLATASLSDTLKYYLDDDYLEHDSYMLLCAVLRGLQRLYTSNDVPSSSGRLPTATSPHKPSEVVRYLERIRDEILSPWDPELTAYLNQANITMELFGIRWVRLLLGREFPRAQLAPLWGLVFRRGPRLLPDMLAPLVAAMLHAHRDYLVNADAGSALSVLMRPSSFPATYLCELALHMQEPHTHPRPSAPLTNNHYTSESEANNSSPEYEVEQQVEVQQSDSSSEGVAEGGDVARELAALALLRARLPTAAAALAAALPRPPPQVARPLKQILQLAALVQCRNHALIDVETALEAAEAGVDSEEIGRRFLVPVALPTKQRNTQNPPKVNKVREVPLKVFHHVEGVASRDNKNLPCLDPLRLRTE